MGDNALTKVINFIFIVLTFVAVMVSISLLYFVTIGKDKVPSAVTSTYATSIIDPITNEELPALEASYYENAENGKGKKVIEFKINAYSGPSKQALYSRGFQLVFDEEGNQNMYCYDTALGNSHITGHEYGWGDKMFIDVDGKLYGVALDGTYQTVSAGVNGWAIAGVATLGVIGAIFWADDIVYNEVITHKYTYTDLLLKISEIVKSSSKGTGNHTIPLVDLGDFLHLYEYDESKGQLSGEPVGDGSLINSYFTIKTRYETRGMTWAKQSLFNSVAMDSTYNVTGLQADLEYWRATSSYYLTEKDFVSRQSMSDNGYFYSLSADKIAELNSFKNIDIYITFNLETLGTNVLGFDYHALNGIKVKQLSLISSKVCEFQLLVGALQNTGLTSIDILHDNITLIDYSSGGA